MILNSYINAIYSHSFKSAPFPPSNNSFQNNYNHLKTTPHRPHSTYIPSHRNYCNRGLSRPPRARRATFARARASGIYISLNKFIRSLARNISQANHLSPSRRLFCPSHPRAELACMQVYASVERESLYRSLRTGQCALVYVCATRQ